MSERTFVIYGDSAMQMFNWLTPHIEQAGYTYLMTPVKDSVGGWEITITKA